MKKLTYFMAIASLGVAAQTACGAQADLAARVRQLEAQVERLQDHRALEKLTRAYGYYLDKQLWSEIVPLFADDAQVEISGRGVYRGRTGVGTLFRQVFGRGGEGLADGALFNHLVLQGIVDVAPEGNTATGRWRAFIQIGQWQKSALWSEGTYQISYIKRNGVWQFQNMRWFGTYFAPYEGGWAKSAFGNSAPSAAFPPDSPPSSQYDAFPGHYVPPFPYPNPVTGRQWTEADTRRYSTQGLDPSVPANARGAISPLAEQPAADSTPQNAARPK